MPELPEVETIRTGLQRLLPGKTIVNVLYDWPKSFPNAEEDVKQFLIGAHIVLVTRRGKALIIELDSKYSLVIHLKMTGQLVYIQSDVRGDMSYEQKKSKLIAQNTQIKSDEVRFGAGHPSDSLVGNLPDRSTRVIFDLDDGGHLYFNDQRKFGWVRLIPTAEVPNIDFFKKMGPEPLSAEFNAKDFIKRLAKRPNTSIKAALLDQVIIAGVGNIYADESLWAAKLHPAKIVHKISDRQKHVQFEELIKVLKLAIEKGGSTDKNYIDAEGKKGSYLKFANVFRRNGHPCPRCGTIIVKLRVAGRGTHICPKCQKA